MNTIHLNNLPKPLNVNEFISSFIKDWSIDIEFIYVSDFKNTKLLRDFVEVICFLLNIPALQIPIFILIVDELNNNAIEYGTEKGWENKLRVKCVKEGNDIEVNIEVEDTWKWIKHKKALEMEILRAHQLRKWYKWHKSIRWRWLFMIIVKTVDRLYFKNTDSGWLVVGIRKKLNLLEK